MAKVFSAKYYKNFAFLEATLENYPSHIWRNSLWGENVLKRQLFFLAKLKDDLFGEKKNYLKE